MLDHEVIELADGHMVGVTTSYGFWPLVFLHGFTVNRRLYEPMLELLAAAGYEVTAIDLAGHGDTDPLPAGHSFDDVVDLVLRTLDEVGAPEAIFVGHSFGGRVAAEIAARTDRVSKLILMGAAVGQPFDNYENAHLLVKLWGTPLRMAAAVLDTALDGPSCPVAAGLYLCRVAGSVLDSWPGFVRVGLAVTFGVDTIVALDTIHHKQIPTTILHGEHDLVVPLACARSAADVSGAQLTVVKGAHHSWMIADQEKGARTIQQALQPVIEGSIWNSTC